MNLPFLPFITVKCAKCKMGVEAQITRLPGGVVIEVFACQTCPGAPMTVSERS